LNVNIGDQVRIRTQTIYGQVQTAPLTLVAIVKFESPLISMFINGGLPLTDLKTLQGYQPHETSNLHIVMHEMGDTGKILAQADDLHRMLNPEAIGIRGIFKQGGNTLSGVISGMQSNKEALDVLKQHVTVLKGDIEALLKNERNILITQSLSEGLYAEPGTEISFSYEPKFEKETIEMSVRIAAVIEDIEGNNSGVAFINNEDLYRTYFNHLPKNSKGFDEVSGLSENSPLFPILSFTWERAERTYTAADRAKKERKMRRMTFYGRILDVVSMKEAPGNLYEAESAIKMMSLWGMMIVFSIILVGVLNTVRMNIRERIREIGTVRAVGMHKKQVIYTFVTEIGLLAFFSSLFGVILAYIFMDVMSGFTFTPVELNFAILLDKGHLTFLPDMTSIVIQIVMITLVTMATAYFPARKAVKMPVAEALGHYE